jgi:hypothetical protein
VEQLHANNDYGVGQKYSLLVRVSLGLIACLVTILWVYFSFSSIKTAFFGTQATGTITSSEPSGRRRCTTIAEVLEPSGKSVAVRSEACGYTEGQRVQVRYWVDSGGYAEGIIGTAAMSVVLAIIVALSLPLFVLLYWLRRNKPLGRFEKI